MKSLSLILLLVMSQLVFAQNDRLNDYNNINWLQSANTVRLTGKWSLHLEYQWRRTEGLKSWQQSLLRVGINRQLNENITAHLGYGWIETFPYGDFPIAAQGTFPEHRTYEQLSFRHPIKKWTFTHRFRVEQRWLGKVKANTDREIEGWTFLHRFRYQFRSQYEFWKKEERQLYAAAADELFIGAGKNLGVNVFDQNRIFLLLGFRFNKYIAIEGGYLNQTLQQGRRVNAGSNTVMQRNNGVTITSVVNL
jgi:hypothetical protein